MRSRGRLPLLPLLPLLLGAAMPLLRPAEAPDPISAEQSLAWGPGLAAGLALPVRYFYIQAVSAAGRNFSRSPPVFTGKTSLQESQAPETRGKVWHKEDLPLVEKELVEEHLNNLDMPKCVVPDSTHLRVLKELADIIARPLVIISVRSQQTGEVPEGRKKSHEIQSEHKKKFYCESGQTLERTTQIMKCPFVEVRQMSREHLHLLSFSYPCFSVAGTLNLQDSQLQPKGEQFVSDSCMLQLPFHKLARRTEFKVLIKALSPKEVTRIYTPRPLDRNDGTFLMRYRMYGSVRKGLKIEILYGDQHVAQSPYILKGPVYHEYCDCPEEDPEIWQNVMSCPSQEPQITKDFTSFPTIDLQRMLKEIPTKFSQTRGAIVHYTILNNRIYRRSLGKYTDFKMFSDEMLLSLARKVHLPDVEFYLNVGDWPVEYRKANDTPGPIPVISWCGSLDSRDIVLPTYDVTHSTLETLRGVTNDLLSIQGNTGPSWENKTEQALFRGRDSREERLHLVKLSKENPELLDAGITGYFFFREKEKLLGKVPLMGFFDFFKYKYQVNVDGTVAAYRFPYLLLGDSLVLKQDSPYYEHFYIGLKPWEHYVPIKRNLEDLLEKIKWAKENDEEARGIAKEGQLMARELLQPHRLYCYYYKVLEKYAKRQASKPEIRDGMELIPQPDDRDSVCSCHRKKPLREDL